MKTHISLRKSGLTLLISLFSALLFSCSSSSQNDVDVLPSTGDRIETPKNNSPEKAFTNETPSTAKTDLRSLVSVVNISDGTLCIGAAITPRHVITSPQCVLAHESRILVTPTLNLNVRSWPEIQVTKWKSSDAYEDRILQKYFSILILKVDLPQQVVPASVLPPYFLAEASATAKPWWMSSLPFQKISQISQDYSAQTQFLRRDQIHFSDYTIKIKNEGCRSATNSTLFLELNHKVYLAGITGGSCKQNQEFSNLAIFYQRLEEISQWRE